MRTFNAALILVLFSLSVAHANCDLTDFRWECELPIKHKPESQYPSLITCGATNIYVSKEQYIKLIRYQKANINMMLQVNGEFVDSPCMPAKYRTTN